MDRLRGEGERLEPVEILRHALESGLSRQEALLEVRKHGVDGHLSLTEKADILPAFFSAVCGRTGAGPVLEYASDPFLLTASLLEIPDPPRLTFAARSEHLAEVLRVAVDGTSASVTEEATELCPDSRWKSIVCRPLLGQRTAAASRADGFGGEVVSKLAPLLAEGGTLYWITGRGALSLRGLSWPLRRPLKEDLRVAATIDLPPGAFPGTAIPGAIIAIRRDADPRRFVGVLRDPHSAERLASALHAGPMSTKGPDWTWLDAEDERTFADLEQDRVLRKLLPRGRHTSVALKSLLMSDDIVKADRAREELDPKAGLLFVPEYATGRVTTDIDSQTVKPRAVYRLTVDSSKANPRFLAQILNAPYGRQLREGAARGATIQRVSKANLLSFELPLPDVATQDRIARLGSDVSLLRASLDDLQGTVEQDWSGLAELVATVDGLKAVLDIERRIEDWWRELPYPLATIYRRYRVSTKPKEQLDTLLHFFEMAAVYLAAIGTSHVRALRSDWEAEFAKWLHPTKAAGIERADFGFWITLAGASLKDVSRIGSDQALRANAIKLAGPELVQYTEMIGPLGKATKVLDVARRYRNDWKGHGGYLKPSDAAGLVEDLHQSVRDFYELVASPFRRLQLVRPGSARSTATGLQFEVERLLGSDPTFEKVIVELDHNPISGVLAFWVAGARTMCRAVPFFRLGAPQEPLETIFYVFNRIENGNCRWISYQEARDQDFTAPDKELLDLIALRSEGRA